MENLVNLPPKTKDELVSKLKELKPLEIWLFGSYAKGVPTSSSDMDLFLVKKKIKDGFSDELIRLRHELGEFQNKYGIEIDLFVDTKSNIRQKIALGDEFYNSVFKTAQKIYTKKGKQYIWLNKMGKFDNLISKVARWLVLVEKNYPI